MTAKTRAIFQSDQATTFADNVAGDISAADLRAEMVHATDSATFPEDLATVATTGDYDDLSNLPTLGTAAASNTGDFAAASHNHAASDTTSGTFADARISEGSVTQHEAALTITESQVSDLGAYATSLSGLSDVDATVGSPSDGDIMVYRSSGSDWVLETKPAGGSNPALADVTDVTITTVADNEVLAYDNGTGDWINQTAAEAGLAAATHAHAASDTTSGTFADARIAASNVTQHEAALSITESQISDLGSYLTGITGESIGDLSDVTLTSAVQGHVLYHNGTAWVNLGPGTSGHFLQTQGAAANPQWASAAGSGDAWGDPVDADIVPNADGTLDLGNDSARFAEAHVQTLYVAGTAFSNLSAPAGDRILFFDFSANTTTYLDLSGLTITGTTMAVDAIPIANLSDWPAGVDATEVGYLDGVTGAIQTQMDTKAPSASPTFTGTPAAPTAAASTNTTQIATTAFVQQEVPAASTTAAGKVELATTAETITGTDTTRAVTPVALVAAAAPVALTDGATITPDFQAGRNFSVTLGGNRTIAAPTNQVAGQSGMIIITQDGTGSRTATFNSAYKFENGSKTLTTTAAAIDVVSYYVQASGTILCALGKAFA